MEVTAKWDKTTDRDLRASHTLRIFLFPFKSVELIRRSKLSPKITWADDIVYKDRSDVSYILLSALFWPLRVFWSVAFNIILFVLAPLIFTVFGIVVSFVIDLGSICHKFISNPVSEDTNTTITQAENS